MIVGLVLIACLSLTNANTFIGLKNVQPCAGADEHLPQELEFGPCHSVMDNKCFLKYGDEGANNVHFKGHLTHKHDHAFDLQLLAEVEGKQYERSIPQDQYTVTCTPTDGNCIMKHHFIIAEHIPRGDHEVTFKMHCKDKGHDAFCYKANIVVDV